MIYGTINYKKKIILALTAFLLAVSLFACDVGEAESSTAPIESSDVEISDVESSAPDSSAPESNAPESNAESNAPDFDQTEPLEIVMTTDKTEYTIDEKIVLTFVANDEAAELGYGHNFFVEYWDEEAKEWKRCKKDFLILEEAFFCYGKGTYTFELSERVETGYPKYRVTQSFISDRFFADKTTGCTVYSNEFTVTSES